MSANLQKNSAHKELVLKQAEARRLAWRCRRGLLELDIVLQRFVASEFKTLTMPELTALDALLALPDNDFWDLLVNNKIKNNSINNDTEVKKVIQKIQSMHQAKSAWRKQTWANIKIVVQMCWAIIGLAFSCIIPPLNMRLA